MNLSEKRRSEEDWIDTLLNSEFFGICMNHKYLRKNEKNVFCIDCNVEICRHCCNTVTDSHYLHRRLQICKYVYQDVLRLFDIQHYFDCSEIQTYKINGEKAIHLNSRPQAKDARPSTKSKNGASCVTCKRYIQDRPNRFCSISCKSVLEKDHSNQEESLEEKKSCTSFLTDVSEDSEVLLSNFSLRPLMRILKRKGISRRSPLY
ncbi:B-box-type zinc finger [Arabidopsis thaliana x Arabidopsis arenosa]|uniref:B-box-type zinc finger n=1 Tax=Arabidopsis thaliana x Arabidopsis arenosa TaxID=1240361 RepID=A0A8T1ZJM5_9BRAS|nr:B-box-type zinc finger [Arabidopsis thaliana x Arabidopsis arenosa]